MPSLIPPAEDEQNGNNNIKQFSSKRFKAL